MAQKKVKVFVKNKKGVLDPQGKTVEQALHSLGYKNVKNMRIGRYLEFDLAGNLPPQKTEHQIREMCKKLLANPVIEEFRFEVEK